ncbi:MAG: diguanylate cyclase domain protein [Bacillales bacterium]|nr:diguanylate cyclase domain protein [Bacillales bacterium]
MVQSVLSNLGILLLMHMIINTFYHFNNEKKISDNTMNWIHVAAASWAIITMYYYPISINGHIYDLRIVPLMFNAFYHGWKKVTPIIVITSIWRLLMGGEHVLFEIVVANIIPPLLALRLFPLYTKPIDYKVFLLFSVSWFISDISLLVFSHDGFYTFATIAPFRYVTLMISALIMHLTIARGRKHLEMTVQLQYYAERDPLTGLYNMRKFDNQIKSFNHTNKKMFVAMIDIDCFKKINDSFGHQMGDNVIKDIAQIIKKYITKDIIVARYGGDEFIFLIASETQEEALAVLDKIRVNVSNSTFFSDKTSSNLRVSLSVGVCEIDDIQKINHIIDKADKQLYLAKQQGRNKICS